MKCHCCPLVCNPNIVHYNHNKSPQTLARITKVAAQHQYFYIHWIVIENRAEQLWKSMSFELLGFLMPQLMTNMSLIHPFGHSLPPIWTIPNRISDLDIVLFAWKSIVVLNGTVSENPHPSVNVWFDMMILISQYLTSIAVDFRYAGNCAIGCINCSEWCVDIIYKAYIPLQVDILISVIHRSYTRIYAPWTTEGAINCRTGIDSFDLVTL